MIKNVFAIFVMLSSINILFSQPIQGTLLNSWTAETLTGSTVYGNTYNEVWGLAINDSEYAIIGSIEGTHFINVTDHKIPLRIFS